MSGYRQWNSTLKRHTPLRSKGRINPRNDERRKRERNRAYGPEERREWVTSMDCVVPGCHDQRVQQAHIETGGMGRKADADKVVPLCFHHHSALDDQLGSVEAFEEEYGVWLPEVAEELERRWQERLHD